MLHVSMRDLMAEYGETALTRLPVQDAVQLLAAWVRQRQPQVVELDHFRSWFKADRQAMVARRDDAQDIASSIMLELHRPEFEAHLASSQCDMEWLRSDSFLDPQEFRGRFRCVGRH